MIAEFHFLRPFWLLAILPVIFLLWYLLKRPLIAYAWNQICDKHLLPWLIENQVQNKQTRPLLILGSCLLCMIIGLAGPTWSKLPVPIFQQMQPRVIILNMTPAMLEQDLPPDRLSRAKFKLRDLFSKQNVGQFGLLVYTGESFVVSPLTDDGQTINALLPSLTPDIMPVHGNHLEKALTQAQELIEQAGSNSGQVLVLTATPPSQASINVAKKLAQHGINTSIIPVLKKKSVMSLFAPLANAGNGHLIEFTDTDADIEHWLAVSHSNLHYDIKLQENIPIWRDQGRWFLIPALFFLLPVFRRGWLQGMNR